MLSIASQPGPTDDELTREIEYAATVLLPELIRRLRRKSDGVEPLRQQIQELNDKVLQLEDSLEMLS